MTSLFFCYLALIRLIVTHYFSAVSKLMYSSQSKFIDTLLSFMNLHRIICIMFAPFKITAKIFLPYMFYKNIATCANIIQPAHHRRAIVLYLRYPKLGQCKPQLIPYVGVHSATFLQRLMTENVVRELQPLLKDKTIQLFGAYEEHTCENRKQCDCEKRLDFWFEKLNSHPAYKDAQLFVPIEDEALGDDGLRVTDSFRYILPHLLERIQFDDQPNHVANGGTKENRRSAMGMMNGYPRVGGETAAYPPVDCARCSEVKPVASGFKFFHQRGPDTATSLLDTFRRLFSAGFDQVIIVSGDVPGVQASLLYSTFAALDNGASTVLGKTNGGGVYLLAQKTVPTATVLQKLLRNTHWNTENASGQHVVYAQMVERCERFGLCCATLRRRLNDVDHLKDLAVMEKIYSIPGRILAEESISVIIPCLNEAQIIESTLTNLVRNFSHRCPLQVVVVDGGSHDDTMTKLRDFRRNLFRYGSKGVELELLSVPVSSSSGGRSSRATAALLGLQHARGAYLMILHGDTLLTKRWDRYMLSTLARPGVVAGSFTFQVRMPNQMVGGKELGLALRVYIMELSRNWRSRRYEMPHGDQALFMHSYYYRLVGGLRPTACFEDIELVQRAWQLGHVAVCDAAVLTSPRRWFRIGFIYGSLMNLLSLVAFRLGVDPDHLVQFYEFGVTKPLPRSD